MAPYATAATTTLSTEEVPTIQFENLTNKNIIVEKSEVKEYKSIIGTYGAELKWLNIIALAAMHAAVVWGFTAYPYVKNVGLIGYAFFIGTLIGLGISAGAHRLWCHRSYKAKLPLRIFLMLSFSMAAQNPLYEWVRDHRVHHRFTETDADPHNSKRGFFFAHVGWLMMKKHPEVIRRGKEIDMSDLMADPVVQFHQKYYVPLLIVFGMIIPTIIPPLVWGQDWYWSILFMTIGRYILSLNVTWLVNSAAHMWGPKPYDKTISPTESLGVSMLTMGEGWHNYHHTFPWDYKAAELGIYRYNFTTLYIDLFSKIGWAYDLRTPSKELIRKAIERTGDGSHKGWKYTEIEYEEPDLLCNNGKNNTTKID